MADTKVPQWGIAQLMWTSLDLFFFFFLINLFILFLAALGLRCCVVRGFLVAVASLVAEHGLSCSATCGIFPDQDLNCVPLH